MSLLRIAFAVCFGMVISMGLQAKEAKAPAHKQVLVTQSWDDGDINDVRLISVLRKYNAKGTFFIFPSKYIELKMTPAAAVAKDKRLIPFDQFLKLYKGFEVGAHGFDHPDMRKLTPEQLHHDLSYTRKVLEDWFKTPILGMAYPYSARNEAVYAAVKKNGYVYGRVVENAPNVFPPANPYDFHPTCHVNDPKFWQEFERVKKDGGVFYFWGHSYEIRTEEEWKVFEEKIAKLSADPDVKWVTNLELFQTQGKGR